MKQQIDHMYAVFSLIEILHEQKLINKETFEAVKIKMHSEKSHDSQKFDITLYSV